MPEPNKTMEKKNKRYLCCRLSPFSSPPATMLTFGPALTLTARCIVNSEMENILWLNAVKKKRHTDGNRHAEKDTHMSCKKCSCLHSQFYLGWPIARDFALCRPMSQHSPDCSLLRFIWAPVCLAARLRVWVRRYRSIRNGYRLHCFVLCNNLINTRASHTSKYDTMEQHNKNTSTVQVKHLWHLFPSASSFQTCATASDCRWCRATAT